MLSRPAQSALNGRDMGKAQSSFFFERHDLDILDVLPEAHVSKPPTFVAKGGHFGFELPHLLPESCQVRLEFVFSHPVVYPQPSLKRVVLFHSAHYTIQAKRHQQEIVAIFFIFRNSGTSSVPRCAEDGATGGERTSIWFGRALSGG